MLELSLVALVVILCLIFTYTNGLQDGSSVTAGLIFCRVLSPAMAVFLVSVCELLGALFGGSAVAGAVKSICNFPDNLHLLPVLSAALSAAIAWNAFAQRIKMPSSSSHALFGGLLGALLAAPGGESNVVAGVFNIFHPTGFSKVLISLFTSPALGFIVGFLMLNAVSFLLIKATNQVSSWLKFGQTVTVALLAFGHGANDPQKTMGIIMLALNAAGFHRGEDIPFWVRAITGVAIALGVIRLVEGIAKRVGTGIFKLRVLHGFVAEAASGFIVVLSSITGCPVSTSQVISSTVMGVGTGEHVKGVHWLVARDILLSWFLTIPAAASTGYILYLFLYSWLDRLFIAAVPGV